MNERLKNYVEKIFEDAPKTKKAYELKEEIISNLTEKYNDLKSLGKTDDESYNAAISNIGNIDEIVSSLKESSNTLNYANNEQQRKKSALLVSLAVGLYILCVVPVMFLSEIGLEIQGVCAMFAMVGIATMLLVYNGVSKPKYKSIDDTMVEEFKEWKSKKDNTNSKKKSIKGAIWPTIFAIYFIISFTFMSWAYSWIIFIIGIAITKIVDAVFDE